MGQHEGPIRLLVPQSTADPSSWRVSAAAGVTAVEVVVVLAILAVTAAGAVLVGGDLLRSARTRGAAQQIEGALRVARQNAIASVSTYRVLIVAGPPAHISTDCVDDPVLTTDCPANRPPRAEEDIIHETSISPVPATIDFTRAGAATPITLTVTYPDATVWQVDVNAAGRVRACAPSCP
jgi:Tfp pilus assembly protein FimT